MSALCEAREPAHGLRHRMRRPLPGGGRARIRGPGMASSAREPAHGLRRRMRRPLPGGGRASESGPWMARRACNQRPPERPRPQGGGEPEPFPGAIGRCERAVASIPVGKHPCVHRFRAGLCSQVKPLGLQARRTLRSVFFWVKAVPPSCREELSSVDPWPLHSPHLALPRGNWEE